MTIGHFVGLKFPAVFTFKRKVLEILFLPSTLTKYYCAIKIFCFPVKKRSGPGENVLKLFTCVICDLLCKECLSVTSLISLVLYLWLRPEPIKSWVFERWFNRGHHASKHNDTQQKDNQDNDTYQNDTQDNATQYNGAWHSIPLC
jgi:hypothetical protein